MGGCCCGVNLSCGECCEGVGGAVEVLRGVVEGGMGDIVDCVADLWECC